MTLTLTTTQQAALSRYRRDLERAGYGSPEARAQRVEQRWAAHRTLTPAMALLLDRLNMGHTLADTARKARTTVENLETILVAAANRLADHYLSEPSHV